MPEPGVAHARFRQHIMSDRKPFLLRIDRSVLDAVQRWANDDLRSLNGQIEFVLRRALTQAGRPADPSPSETRQARKPGRAGRPEEAQD